MDNVVLIGMPTAGKSTVGVILAKLLAYDFIDTDLLIQRREGKSLSGIIDERGIDAFLAAEEAACLSLDVNRTVIATGGSVVYGDAAMGHLKALGRVVYLDVGYETLQERLRDVHDRGVVLREGQSIRDLYDERERLYRRYADVTVQEGAMSLEEVVSAVYSKCIGKY